jgi:hypothetical protein
MVDYTCTNGEWEYAPMVPWDITIPLPDGGGAQIKQLPADTARKMLGVWSSPSGNNNTHLDNNIIARYRTWISRSKNGHLLA